MKHLALFLSLLASARVDVGAAAKSNTLIILAADLGSGDVRCYNDRSKVATPNLDCRAREGMRFTAAHSPATVCTIGQFPIPMRIL